MKVKKKKNGNIEDREKILCKDDYKYKKNRMELKGINGIDTGCNKSTIGELVLEQIVLRFLADKSHKKKALKKSESIVHE